MELVPDNFEIHSTYLTKNTNIKNITEHKIDLMGGLAIPELIEKIEPQIIFHTAKVKFFDDNPEENKKSVEMLARVAKKKGIKLIFVSTDAVFDGKKGNYEESDKLNPINAYGLSKKLAEETIKSILDNFIIIRTSYIYGKNIFGYDKRTAELLKDLNSGKDIFRFKDLIRSFTPVKNLAEACWKLIETDFSGVVHIAGEKDSMFGYSRKIAKIAGLNEDLIMPNSYKETGKIFAPDTSLDTKLAGRLISFNPQKISKNSFLQ